MVVTFFDLVEEWRLLLQVPSVSWLEYVHEYLPISFDSCELRYSD